MPNPVVHWEIQSNQAAELQEYYSKLFGWKISTDNPIGYGLVETRPEGAVGINGGIGPTSGPNQVTFFVEVDDLDAYLKKAEGLGGKTVVPVTTIPDMVTFALFSDPEGNVVGIVKDEGQHR